MEQETISLSTDRPGMPGPLLAEQWARVRGRLQTEVGQVEYRSWLRQMTLGGSDGDEVTVQLPTRFLRDWVRDHYGDRLSALWQAEDRRIRRVDVRVAPDERRHRAARAGREPDRSPAEPARAKLLPHPRPRSGPTRARDRRQRSTRASPSRPSWSASRTSSPMPAPGGSPSSPASAGFNPLFLYGGVGLGKTHLMHAIAWELAGRGATAAGPSRWPTCRPRSSCTASSPRSAASPRWSSRSSSAASTC